MPELPDVVVYIDALEKRILNHTLKRVLIGGPFLIRTATPPVNAVVGRKVTEIRRIGKRIAIGFEGDLWLVFHLMIAGRLHWHDKPVKPSKVRLAIFDFDNGTLSLTEAGSQRRAALHVFEGAAALEQLNRGGIEIFETNLEQFSQALLSANHTLKRALSDPRLFSGIGNAYSDEILWQAKLSPVALTQKLTPAEVEMLFESTRASLTKWIERLRDDAGEKFPEKVTAFRDDMAVHGRYLKPCPRCGNRIQRIRYAANETNYCPTCQTGGKLLADRALSRLLRADWPRTAEELEDLPRKKFE